MTQYEVVKREWCVVFWTDGQPQQQTTTNKQQQQQNQTKQNPY